MHHQAYEIREQKSLFGVLDDTSEEGAMLEELREPKSLFTECGENSDAPLERVAAAEEAEPELLPFWQRQFQPVATQRQREFDWIFGVLLPVVCFAFDPIVFSGAGSRTVLAPYTIFAYILSIVSIMAMVAWLQWGKRLGWLTPFLAGLFVTGSMVSALIGMYLLPLSTLGLIVLIGALGFTPLFSSFVFFRNAYRACGDHELFGDARATRMAVVLSSLFSLAIPLVINFQFIDPASWQDIGRPLL